MSALQAFLICKPPLISNLQNPNSRRLQFQRYYTSINLGLFSLTSNRKKFRPLFALHQDNVDLNSDLVSATNDNDNLESKVVELREDEVSSTEINGEVGKEKGKFPLLVFLMGFFTRIKIWLEKMLLSDWFSWWPFWRQEKKLELLISEADLNPKDAAKQTALLVELNKHRCIIFLFFS